MSGALTESGRALARHMLATLAYRGGKAIRGAPEGFGDFLPPGAMNTPRMLLAHIGDLVEWAHRWTRGNAQFAVSEPKPWGEEVARFHAVLAEFDATLVSGAEGCAPAEALLQAPVADALTHIGQIALLRRMAGDPVAGEAYRLAEIVPGRLGPEQAAPGREFERDKGALWRG
jgi:hypothetical protein